jgi:hypothetical protein
MIDHKHYRGFEKEALFRQLFRDAVRDCPGLTFTTFCRIVRHIAPDFLDGLFSVRPCVRQLRYVRSNYLAEKGAACLKDFVPGRVYESIDFNGGDYGIKGYESGRIGYSCFEVVEA